jgi:intein/homing endonuclease
LLVPQLELDAAQETLLALMRTKGFSIKYLDEAKKEDLRLFLVFLHEEKGMSLNDVANLVGNKTSGYTSWLYRQLGVKCRPFEEARLKGIREKRRKYERKPFDGTDEDKAYLLGLRHGDLSVSEPWKGVVRVSTSTTHPAMVELFRSLFEPYGHVYQSPRYKKDTKSYEWNLSTILDDSFSFLLALPSEVGDWITSKPSLVRAYLAGLFDAEGSVSIHASKAYTVLNATYYNTDLELMRFVFQAICSLSFHPQRPYLDKKKGFRSPGYHIEMKKDYWRVVLGIFGECQTFLRILPIRHQEKTEKKSLALELRIGMLWIDVGPKVERIRTSIRNARDRFVSEAEREYLANPKHALPIRTAE